MLTTGVGQEAGELAEAATAADHEAQRQPDQRPGHQHRGHEGHDGHPQPTSFIRCTASSRLAPAPRSIAVDRDATGRSGRAPAPARRPARPRTPCCCRRTRAAGRGSRGTRAARWARAGVAPPDHPDPGEVHVRAATALVRPLDGHREVRVLLELAAQVVRVDQADVAATLGDRLEHVGVRAEELRVVGHPAPEHALGRPVAVLGDAVRHEVGVVLARPGAEAELALPARVAEGGVGGHLLSPHPLRGAHDRPGPLGEPVPLALGIAQVARHAPIELPRADQGSRSPASSARQRLAASTVIRTSALVWSPSLRSRS